MKKLFNSVQFMKPRKNKFDLSCERKMSMNFGGLYPCYYEPVVPGDYFRAQSEVFVRFAPLLAPIMSRFNCFIEYWYVPDRLVWPEFNDFITGGRLGTSAPAFPTLTIADVNRARYAKGLLPDYFAIPTTDGPTTVTDELVVSSLPFRAYQLIYDEFYRDQNLTAPIGCSTASGAIASNSAEELKLVTMRKRAWEKDYSTSALPFAQRGVEVLVPIDGNVNPGTGAVGLQTSDWHDNTVNQNILPNGSVTIGTGGLFHSSGNVALTGVSPITGTGFVEDGNMLLTNLRRASRLQEWLERMATGGARMYEAIKAEYGEESEDARLQRPQFLGGGRTPVVISEVLSTFQDSSGDDLPQGNMAGHGVAVGGYNGFKRKFKEHGHVIGLMSVLPRTAYQQGCNVKLRKFDKFDYLRPQFAEIGEQVVSQGEVFHDYDGNSSPGVPSESLFGYQSRYSEYKYGDSTVHGDMRDNLAFWHDGRIFSHASPPVLNTAYIEADPSYRIFAVTDPAVHHLYVQLYHKVDAVRPLPYFGTPKL